MEALGRWCIGEDEGGVSKVLGLRLPERRVRCWAEERKCGCLEGAMGGGLEEGDPALERT